MTTLLVLDPKWKSTSFQRTCRDRAGNLVATLVFEQKTPIELDDDLIRHVRDDVGAALRVATYRTNDHGTRLDVDADATDRFVVRAAQERMSQGYGLFPHQKRAYDRWNAAEQNRQVLNEEITTLLAERKSIEEQFEESPDPQLADRLAKLTATISEKRKAAGIEVEPPKPAPKAETVTPGHLTEIPEGSTVSSASPPKETPADKPESESDDDGDDSSDDEVPIEIQIEEAESELDLVQQQLDDDPDNADLKKQVASAKRRITNLKKKLPAADE